MPSFKLVVPTPIKSVEIQTKKKIEEDIHKAYLRAFNAGYHAGTLQAEMDASAVRQLETQEFQGLKKHFEALLPEWKKSMSEALAELLSAAFERMYATFRPSPEDLACEIDSFLKELTHAAQITLHLSPAEFDTVQNLLKETESSLHQGVVQWNPNAELKSGEFLLQSDLGSVDGRHLTRLHRVRNVM